MSPLQVTWLACTAGAVACLPSRDRSGTTPATRSASAIGWTIYLGIVPTAIGFIAWAYALSRTTAGRMGSTTYLVTPIAILLGWLLLGETPPGLALAGGALCLAGVAVARRASRASTYASRLAAPPRPPDARMMFSSARRVVLSSPFPPPASLRRCWSRRVQARQRARTSSGSSRGPI